MTGKGLVDLDPVQRLVTHKDYTVEMVTSIIKETDLDLCGGQTSEDFGAYSLYDLSRVCSCQLCYTLIILLVLTIMLCLRRWYA